MAPVVAIVGGSKSGKTTLVERLIGELKGRGYRVATVKHTRQQIEIDEPGKDSWRHAEAGSETVVISSPRGLALIRPGAGEASLDQILRLIGEGFDIVLAEGFHQERVPKIEVHRSQSGEGLRCDPEELMAIVTDEPLDNRATQLPPDGVAAIADLIEKQVIAPKAEDTVLVINDEAVSLNRFTRQMLANILLGMVETLKGVEEVRNIDVSVRKRKG